MSENREMFEEVNALLAAVAKALDLNAEDCVRAIEAQEIAMALEVDDKGQNFVEAQYQGKTVRVYQGAIQYAPEEPEAAPEDDCGHHGCGCGDK
jgi:hypothetical protein